MKLLEGKLLLYSETGSEGSYLAIQDNQFIAFTSPVFGITNDRKAWDRNDLSRSGLTSSAEVLIDNSWLELPDPILKDKDFEISSLSRGEQLGDLNADRRLAEKF